MLSAYKDEIEQCLTDEKHLSPRAGSARDGARAISVSLGGPLLTADVLHELSHELRSSLSLALGHSELLLDRVARLSSEQVAAMAAEIQAACGVALRLVEDVDHLAELHDWPALNPRPVAIVDHLRHLVNAYQSLPGGERIVADLPDALDGYLDPERLSQVVGNLLTNALRYAPDGQIILRADALDGRLHVEVCDQGPGVPWSEQTQVWDRALRGRSGRATPPGSGLGLAVVKHLVELQGGTVGLRSIPGQGATFSFSVPLEPRRVPARVLVVDDDPFIRDFLETVLKGEGYDVVLAGDGVDALTRLTEPPPNVILLDLMMPRMDGLTFEGELRRRGLRPGVPLILMSAAERVRAACAQTGAEGYLSKPFALPTLLEEVARLTA
jgi:two-component system, sensor histidine kinase ChiS